MSQCASGVHVLQEYIVALERENEAKNQERQVLNQAIEELKDQLAKKEAVSCEPEWKLLEMKNNFMTRIDQLSCAIRVLTLQNVRLMKQNECMPCTQSDQQISAVCQERDLANQILKMVEDENIKLCQKLAELERNVSELENIKITLESQLEEATKCWKCSQQQVQHCKAELKEREASEFKNTLVMEMNIQEVQINYNKIEQLAQERQWKLTAVTKYALNLERQCQELKSNLDQLLHHQPGTQMPSNSPDCFGLDVLQLVRQNNEMVEWISQLNTKTLIFEKLPIAHGTLKHSLLALKAENASLVNQLIY